jgi:hypothetical protein
MVGPVELGLKVEKMTKTPYEVEPPRQPTKAEREARKAFREVDAKKAISDHDLAQKVFYKNKERLKAERLAREAEAPTQSQEPQKKK